MAKKYYLNQFSQWLELFGNPCNIITLKINISDVIAKKKKKMAGPLLGEFDFLIHIFSVIAHYGSPKESSE